MESFLISLFPELDDLVTIRGDPFRQSWCLALKLGDMPDIESELLLFLLSEERLVDFGTGVGSGVLHSMFT